MLKKFEMSNFKNLKDKIVIDFTKVGGYQFSKDCVNEGVIGKMLIYGRNAVGKTNLGRGIGDIITVFLGADSSERESFINADNVKSKNDCASFCYYFQFDGDEIIYKYTKSSVTELCEECCIVNGKQVFNCDFNQDEFVFDDLSLIGAETVNTDKFIWSAMWDDDEERTDKNKMSFACYLINSALFSRNSVFVKLEDYVRRMRAIGIGFILSKQNRLIDDFFDRLLEDAELKKFEKFLNVMGVDCELACVSLPDGRSELYFVHDKLISFRENASSGTLALMNLYRRLFNRRRNPSFIFLDEFDAYYHYEMSRSLIEFLKYEYPDSQIILTTHNTNLMSNRYFRPDCLFILSRDGRLTALCDATTRELREGHNLEKMYISGEFDAYE